MSDDNKKDKTKSKPDKDLWKRVQETIKPLTSRNLFHESFTELLSDEGGQKGKKQPTKKAKHAARPQPTKRSMPTYSSKASNAQGKGGIDKRTDDKLRKGKMPIQARLDLHGMRQNEAYSALVKFINEAYQQQKRVALIITGKGYRSSEPGGVLRRLVPIWLSEEPFKSKILSCHAAQPKDGGEGALYLLLKRDKKA